MKRLAIVSALILTLGFSLSAQAQDRISYARRLVVGAKEITGDVVCFFCTVSVHGAVQGDAVTIGGDITVDGSVSGDVVAVGGYVRLESGAKVGTDVVAIGGLATKEADAHTRQDDPGESIPWVYVPGQRHIGWRGALAMLGFYGVAMLFARLILLPRRLQVIAGAVTQRPAISGVIGVLSGGAVVFLLDEASRLGRFESTADLFFLFVVGVLFVVGTAGIALVIGELTLPRSPARALANGTFVIFLLQLIPVVGAVVFLLLMIFAIGCALWSGLGFRRRATLKP